jgi:hypothetical protein
MSTIFQIKGKGTTLKVGDMIVVNGGGLEEPHKVRVQFARGAETLTVVGSENGVIIPLQSVVNSIELAKLIAATHNLEAVLPDIMSEQARALFHRFEEADYVFLLQPAK